MCASTCEMCCSMLITGRCACLLLHEGAHGPVQRRAQGVCFGFCVQGVCFGFCMGTALDLMLQSLPIPAHTDKAPESCPFVFGLQRSRHIAHPYQHFCHAHGVGCQLLVYGPQRLQTPRANPNAAAQSRHATLECRAMQSAHPQRTGHPELLYGHHAACACTTLLWL